MSLNIHRLAAAMLTLAGLVLTACDTDAGAASDEPPVDGERVAVVDNDFEPDRFEVTVGDTVTWHWQGRAAHDVVGDGFESDVQQEGTFSHTFEDEGTYAYRCTLHRGMEGTVVVAVS